MAKQIQDRLLRKGSQAHKVPSSIHQQVVDYFSTAIKRSDIASFGNEKLLLALQLQDVKSISGTIVRVQSLDVLLTSDQTHSLATSNWETSLCQYQ